MDVHKILFVKLWKLLERRTLMLLSGNGHTRHAKTEIFAQRVAPVQINYLGYPGTIGGDFIDYIVADKGLYLA